MPIEGFIVKGPNECGAGSRERTNEEVNHEFVELYRKISERGGKLVAKETLSTLIATSGFGGSAYRQDTHLIVDFPESESAQPAQ